jgi:Flp pilus assembly protein TadG
MNLLKHRRGSVALITALMAPVMVMAMAMGIEVTSWSVTNVDLQRVADVAAWAGAAQYVVSPTPQTATATAAQVAEINGVSGTSPRTWNAATLTTSDNLITAQVVNGVKSAADTAIQVTVSQTIAKSFSSIFVYTGSQSSVTVTATAIAEIVSAAAGPQPCLVALQAGGSGISLSGSPDITSSTCSVRSNSTITLAGTSSINVDGTYAAGAITIPVWNPTAITGGTYANAGTIPDQYASDTVLQTALSALAAGTTPGPVIPDPNTSYLTQTINPGTYASLTLGGSSNITLTPGTYYVKGNVTFDGAATVTGSNVTIISLGTLTDAGSAAVSLTAPTTASGDGIPGMLFASENTGSSTYSGAVASPFTGVIYYPNGNLTFSGSVNVNNPSTACGEVIAGSITITGAATLSTTGCAPYGTLPFGSLPTSTSIVLVE